MKPLLSSVQIFTIQLLTMRTCFIADLPKKTSLFRGKETTYYDVLFLGLLGLFLLASIFFFKKSQQKQKLLHHLKAQYRALETQNHALSEHNNKQQVLLNEIHHRIKNNLQFASSLLHMKIRTTRNSQAKAALEETALRFQSMLLVHQKLYSTPSSGAVDVQLYTEQLTHYLLQSYIPKELEVSKQITLQAIAFQADTLIPYGLLLTELITNSIKHAKPINNQLRIDIQLAATAPGHYALRYSDNGQGISPAPDWQKPDTIGLRLLHSLTAQLQGNITYKFDEASIFTIYFSDPTYATLKNSYS